MGIRIFCEGVAGVKAQIFGALVIFKVNTLEFFSIEKKIILAFCELLVKHENVTFVESVGHIIIFCPFCGTV